MKLKLLIALTIMSVGVWLACVGLVGKAKLSKIKLDTDCRDYLARAMPKMLTLDFQEWRLRASHELLSASDLKQVKHELALDRKLLGKLRHYGEISGTILIDDETGQDVIMGLYSCRAKYKNAPADIEMKLVKREGTWKFQSFSIRSEVTDPGF